MSTGTVEASLTASSTSAPFGRLAPAGGRDVLPPARSLDLDAFARLFEDTATSYKHLFFRAILEEFRLGGYRERIFSFSRLAVGMLEASWYPCRVHGLSLGLRDQVAKILARVAFVDHGDPPTGAIRTALSAERATVSDLTGMVRYRLIAPFFVGALRGVPDSQKNGVIRRLANDDFETVRPLYRFVDGDGIELHPGWAEYIAASFPTLSSWAERYWVDYLQSHNPSAAAVWDKIGPPAVSRPDAPSNSLDSAGFFPPSALESLDLVAAQAAVDALSKRGFDRVAEYRDPGQAFAYLDSLGYSGPGEAAAAHLQDLIDRRRVYDASASAAPNADSLPGGRDGLSSEELDDGIGSFEDGPAPPEGASSQEHGASLPTVADLLGWADISVRLFNVSRGTRLFADWTIAEALAHRADFLVGVRRLANAGVKTVSEVSGLLDGFRDGRIFPPAPVAGAAQLDAETDEEEAPDLSDPRLDKMVVDILRSHSLTPRAERILGLESLRNLRMRDLARDRAALTRLASGVSNIGKTTLDEVDRIVSACIEGILAGTPLEEKVDDPRPPRERLLAAISAFDRKQSEVLRWRYGLDGCQVMTLQEIGETVHVTRERVRQVEHKALRRLQKGPSAVAVSDFINAEQESQWALLTRAKSWVDEDELPLHEKAIDPLFRIAVDAHFGRLRSWLDRFATRTENGWTRRSEEGVPLQGIRDALRVVARSRPCPIPLSSLGPEIGNDMNLLEEGYSCQDWSIFEGYLCVGYLGPRVRRRVRLHAVALDIADSGFFDIGSLIKAYRAKHPDDIAGSRVLLKEMDEAPHLFLCIFDYLWLALPAPDDLPLQSMPVEDGQIGDDTFEEGTGAARIAEMLRDGPRRRTDIASALSDEGVVSKSSAVPLLASNPCFRRVAPGVFGLYGCGGLSRDTLRSEMLNEADCRLFCFAMYSGVPKRFFPAWGADYEMAVTHWAGANVPTDVFRSLLSVVEPLKWPIAEEKAAQMEEIRRREGRWSIGFDRVQPLGHRFIDPQQFLRMLAYLTAFGSIGWCAVNRLSGARLNKADAADILAFLALTGLVEPGDDWQAPHAATAEARRTFSRAAGQWERTGTLAWNDSILGPIMASLDGKPRRIGWVEAEEVEKATTAWRTGRLPTGRAFEGAEDEPPDIEETLGSDEWLKAFGGGE
jgi:RNA polymerase sigma factor (sigma-70 family)